MMRKHNNNGFTLIELLIVCVILVVLAAIIIPQLIGSTDSANEAALKTSLDNMRTAITLYAAQHGNRLPGVYSETDGTTPCVDDSESAQAMIAQLTQYTDGLGAASMTKDATHTFGPYLEDSQLPTNPYTNTRNLIAMNGIDNKTTCTTADGSTAYRYCPNLGTFIANDDVAHQTW